ncbi:hypothetical protein WDU94_002077 [Cyamophila willieti]
MTRYLDLQLRLLRLLGLFNLPFSHRYSSMLHRIYMRFTFTFFAVMLTASSLGAMIKLSQDFIVFFTVLMESIALLMVFTEVIFLNLKRKDLFKLLSQMKKFNITTRPNIFITCRKLERILWFAMYGIVLFVITIKFVSPFLPISNEEAAHLQALYGFSHPQNRLPHFLWLPFLDTSKPLWFTLFYFVNLYWVALDFALGTTEAVFFPSILLHLVGQHLVLSGHLKMLGKSPPGKSSRSFQDPLKKAYDLFHVRKCIVIHRRLLNFRTLVGYSTECGTYFFIILGVS